MPILNSACPLNAFDKHALDFVLTRTLMKIFKTGSNVIITECRQAFEIKLLSENAADRKITFLRKYANNCNVLCRLFAGAANNELNELISLRAN